VVFDFGNRRKRNLHYLAVGALHLDAGSGECLSCFHAANDAADALSVDCNDLNIVFAIKRLQCRKCFGNFQVSFPPKFKAVVALNLNVDGASILHGTLTDV